MIFPSLPHVCVLPLSWQCVRDITAGNLVDVLPHLSSDNEIESRLVSKSALTSLRPGCLSGADRESCSSLHGVIPHGRGQCLRDPCGGARRRDTSGKW